MSLAPSKLPTYAWLMRACALLILVATGAAQGQELDELQVGHWVVVKGTLGEDGRFNATLIEIAPAEDEEFLLGTVTRADSAGGWIELLGQRVTLSKRTRLRNLSLDDIVGQRVKVEGHYRGMAKFSARSIAPRKPGRDRIAGRIDELRIGAGKAEFDVMRFVVVVADGSQFSHERPLDDFELIAQRALPRSQALVNGSGPVERTDEDWITGTIKLSDTLYAGLRLSYRNTTERDYDLDGSTAADRIDDDLSARGVLAWRPAERLMFQVSGRANIQLRQDESDGYTQTRREHITEAFGYWSDVFGVPVDLQVGRQNYYDDREWLWDQNLDAVRLLVHPGAWRFELAATTTLSQGSPREEETDRWIAQLSHEEPNRMWGAYLIDQRTNLDGRSYPFFAGLRAYGEWIPNSLTWAELAVVRGYQDYNDLRGWGFDLGATWSPAGAKPWYFTAGYAFGSGDSDPEDGVNSSFRQTGIQDNNDKLGGVTSFKYYGELIEPELSNLHILTLGLGRRFKKRFSLDLMYHKYVQDEAYDRLRNTSLRMRPNGIATDIGQELDLIYGHRSSSGLDTEIVVAAFDPGSAFDDSRRAYLVKFQLRYRF